MPDIETARELGQLQERVRGLDSKFGNLETKMDAMDSTMRAGMADLSKKFDALNLLAERSKGGLWVLIGVSSVLSSVATWFIKHMTTAGPP
jgi:hypothetical protein